MLKSLRERSQKRKKLLAQTVRRKQRTIFPFGMSYNCKTFTFSWAFKM